MKNDMLSYGLIFLSALLDSYAAFVVKSKFNELGEVDLGSLNGFIRYMTNFIKSPVLITALIAFVTAPGLWFFALNRMDLSIGYPILVGFHLLFVFIFGIAFLGEGITTRKVFGSLLVLISFFLFYKK